MSTVSQDLESLACAAAFDYGTALQMGRNLLEALGDRPLPDPALGDAVMLDDMLRRLDVPRHAVIQLLDAIAADQGWPQAPRENGYKTRFAEWWCPRCPTRVAAESETDGGEEQLWEPQCPACEGRPLVSLEELVETGEVVFEDVGDVPLTDEQATEEHARLHAAWLKKRVDPPAAAPEPPPGATTFEHGLGAIPPLTSFISSPRADALVEERDRLRAVASEVATAMKTWLVGDSPRAEAEHAMERALTDLSELGIRPKEEE